VKHAPLCMCVECMAEIEPNFGIPLKYNHCYHCEREDSGECITDVHYEPCPFEDCPGEIPL